MPGLVNCYGSMGCMEFYIHNLDCDLPWYEQRSASLVHTGTYYKPVMWDIVFGNKMTRLQEYFESCQGDPFDYRNLPPGQKICFSDGYTFDNRHYALYLDPTLRDQFQPSYDELVPPNVQMMITARIVITSVMTLSNQVLDFVYYLPTLMNTDEYLAKRGTKGGNKRGAFGLGQKPFHRESHFLCSRNELRSFAGGTSLV